MMIDDDHECILNITHLYTLIEKNREREKEREEKERANTPQGTQQGQTYICTKGVR